METPDPTLGMDGGGTCRAEFHGTSHRRVLLDPEMLPIPVVVRQVLALVGYEDLDSVADALAALQATEADRRVRYPDPFPHARRSAFLDGFSLHAGVHIHANDRALTFTRTG